MPSRRSTKISHEEFERIGKQTAKDETQIETQIKTQIKT